MADWVADLFSGGLAVRGLVLGVVVGLLPFAAGLPAARRPIAPVLLSVGCAFAVYTCTPDTELAQMFGGTIVGAGLVAIVLRAPWSHAWLTVSALLGLTAVIDGRGRHSAIVGGLGVAAVHGLLQRIPVRRRRGEVTVIALGAVTSLLCARVAGLADSVGVALAIATPVVAATALLLWSTSGRRDAIGVVASWHADIHRQGGAPGDPEGAA